jgi:glycosyltransferase 2 family protein
MKEKIYYWLNKISPVIGIILFLFIISRINLSIFLKHLPQINWLIVSLTFILMFFNLLIKNWRWQLMLKKHHINYSFGKSLLIYSSGIYFGALTPGRIGELGRLYYLKKDNHPTTESLTTLFLDKILDLAFVFIIGVFSLAYFHQYLKIEYRYVFVILFFLIAFLAANRLIPFLLPTVNQKILKLKQQVKDNFSEYRLIDLINFSILTALSWLIYFYIAYLLTLAVGIYNISFIYSSLVMNLTSLISLLPISIMGLGTRESLFIFFYQLKNQPAELSLTVSMIILLVNLSTIFLGFIAWLLLKFKTSSSLLPATGSSGEPSHNHPLNKP